ncbi:MAG: hypothetical protein J2P54_00230 [Bradyrhizobiaceae bacterium]|nr:hypothetical protein [Bradyrhizobiaceae bacterium]
MTKPRVYRPLNELVPVEGLPFGDVLEEAAGHIWLANPAYNPITSEATVGLFIDQEVAATLPGLPALSIALGSVHGGVDFDIHARFQAPAYIGVELPLTLRVDAEILRPLMADSVEPDLSKKTLDIALGSVELGIDTEGNLKFDVPAGIRVPRCMIGATGIVITIGLLRWLTPSIGELPANTPPGFTGVYFDDVQLELPALSVPVGKLTLDDVFIGTGGFSGKVAWSDPNLTWNPKGGTNNDGAFEGTLVAQLGGFDGALKRIAIEFKQNALFACEIEGCIYAPYIKRVIGLDLGLDGNGGFTAIAKPPSCKFTNDDASAAAGDAKPGYILSADIENVFKFDVSRVEFHTGGGQPASLSLSGRVKLVIASFNLPAVEFKGLSINTRGHVAIEGGWLDVDQAKSGPLSGFPLQITRIGFGVEKDGRAWVGLNGSIKLHEMLPAGVSVEGLKVSWKDGEPVNFSLEGIGVELAVQGVFSFVGKAAFFQTDEASGFRGSLKLSLDSVGLTIDVGIMVGRMNDGTYFFYLFIDVDLPVGIPLFSTGAALYGFAGLLAVNLQPARIEAEHWYYGYYKRQPVGVTAPEKWAVKRDAFAIGVGTTIGSMPDTGYAISAKVLLILSLPGPRILLQGKGSFIEKKPENKDQKKEGTFEALLVLDTPAKLFQANLAITFKMGAILEVGGGVDAAFSWADQPPPDAWHVYVGEKEPVERRVHAKVLEFLKGDTWLMINRPHYFKSADATTKERIGDFEIGGSLMLGADYDFSVAKVWLHLSMFAQAAVTWEPQQIMANADLMGSAGISALGMELSAELDAKALTKASKPLGEPPQTPGLLYFGASVEVQVRVNLIFFKWEFHEKIGIEYTRLELPDYVRDFVAIKADHMKASEAHDLQDAVVPPDVRPVIIFSKPVRDLAWFGAPGDPELQFEDLHARQVSYQLRHIVLLANDGTAAVPNWRILSAAGRASVNGANVQFLGLDDVPVDDRLPDLTGAELRLFSVGDTSGQSFVLSAGGSGTATLTGSAPQGELCYRLSPARGTANVSIASVADAGFGQVEATLVDALANPQRFRGGVFTSAGTQWNIVDATATVVRLQTNAGVVPAAGAATLAGPDPAQLRGAWQAAGEPVESGGSSTRLQVWARTPYSMFRYNDLDTITGLDAFDPDYACGPTPVEQPVCTHFEDLPVGPLAAVFVTASIQGANNGTVTAVATGGAKTLTVGRATVTLTFDPPADAVWVTATRREYGVIRAFSNGVKIAESPVETRTRSYRFDGGIDRVEIESQDASIEEVCYLPGWTCVAFEETFPQDSTGEVIYAGMRFGSAATMRVVDGVLHAVAGSLRISPSAIGERARLLSGLGTGAGKAVIEVPGLEKPFVAMTPILGEACFMPGTAPANSDPRLRARAVAPRTVAQLDISMERLTIQKGSIWSGNVFVPMVTLVIEFPRLVTRARITLGARAANLVALAGALQVTTATGAAGATVAMYADPDNIGWFNRVVLTAPSEVQISEICTDRGDFGWQRYQQWSWRQGVQSSIESLYSQDSVLPPGKYELRVHTAAVVTGEQPTTENFTARAAFTVGRPPGFVPPLVNPLPAGTDQSVRTYPDGGPLTQLATYVERTMPAHGARLWYRNLDTAVGFNENYVTRMFLEADEELRVFVLNSSDVALRDGTRHIWASGSAELDATTSLYVRTLAGDGTDICANVDMSRIALPESVTAGAGELLDASSLHRSQLRTRGSDVVVHEFEFTTSRFASFLHLTATYDGLCPRLSPRAQNVAWNPRDQAQTRSDALANLETARTQSVATVAAGRAANVKSNQIKAAADAPAALATTRASTTATAVAAFADLWAKSFDGIPRNAPAGLRLSVVSVGNPTATDLLLLESPEPIAWDRVTAGIVPAAAAPLDRVTIMLGGDFGRPDLGFEVAYGGLRWRAGVELWFDAGALRARADVSLDVTLLFPRSSSADLVVRAEDPMQLIAECDPPASQVTVTALPEPGTYRLRARAPALTTLRSLRVRGDGVGIVTCTVDTPFRPRLATGPLRIVAAKLPASASDLTHEVTLMALAPVSLLGWSVRWIDPLVGGGSQLYAVCSADLTLAEAQRVRLVPSVASSPVIDDAMVLAGGPGIAPPPAGAIFQLFDPTGTCVHEYVAMVPSGSARTLAIIPDADGSRAFLIPPRNEAALAPGFWEMTLSFAGDLNAPDLERWTVGGRVVAETARLPLLIEEELAVV